MPPPATSTTLADGQALRSYPVTDFAGLAKAMAQGPVQVLDTRRNDERAAGYVAGSRHIPLHELPDRLGEVPRGEVWVYCGSGYRASIAASILDRPGRQVVLINDDYDNASTPACRTNAPPTPPIPPSPPGPTPADRTRPAARHA